jgi:hypothetical protein
MRIPVSSPAVLGRLKEFCKPYDFVLAPVIREGDLQLDEEGEKPILVTRFSQDSEEWSTATYYNVRSGDPYSITTGESNSENVAPVLEGATTQWMTIGCTFLTFQCQEDSGLMEMTTLFRSSSN